MKTYSQLDATQKVAALNYHLNSMISVVIIEDNPAGAPSWTNHDAIIANFTPIAQARAEASLYGDDPATGILPVMDSTAPKEELDKAFFLWEGILGQYENNIKTISTAALDKPLSLCDSETMVKLEPAVLV